VPAAPAETSIAAPKAAAAPKGVAARKAAPAPRAEAAQAAPDAAKRRKELRAAAEGAVAKRARRA
jgi:hypothetical protein